MSGGQSDTLGQLQAAVDRSERIDQVLVMPGGIGSAGALFAGLLGEGPALIVADDNTWAATGDALVASLESAGISVRTKVLAAVPRIKPMRDLGDALAAELRASERIVALGSGVINDLAKYAAFTRDTPYMCVATAASMDGYTSAGAPLVDRGFKKTIDCRPPRVVLADTDVIAAAPPAMTGWGFGDLAGKVPAGGDWMIADALGVEVIDNVAWPMVQHNLGGWLTQAKQVGAGQPEAMDELFAGLALIGFAMEFHGTSRPASGADHQIAHIWEMESHEYNGERVSHGACVAVGCMVSLRLFDWLLTQDLSGLDVARLVETAPQIEAVEAEILSRFDTPAIAERAVAETRGKLVSGPDLAARLGKVVAVWPALAPRLRAHLISADTMAGMLRDAGAPVSGGDIGIDTAHLRRTVEAARFIRSRYTVLDLLAETGLLVTALDAVIGTGGDV